MERKGKTLAALAMTMTSGMPSISMAQPRLGEAPLYAAGVYTPDVEETARQYERVFGVVPQDFGTPTPSAPDGSTVTLKMSVVFFPNFYIKLQQPVSENGPYAEGLRKYGTSIQNIQLLVEGDVQTIQALRADMVRKGGTWTLGVDTDFRAYVEFKEKLGITLEPITLRPKGKVIVAAGATAPALGSMPVTHIGFAVTDARKTAEAYGHVFGIPVPEVREIAHLRYPAGSTWNETAHLRVARWRQGEIGIELTESVGEPTPWSAFVKAQNGNAAQVIAFDVGSHFDEILHDLQAKGGKWIFGTPAGGTAYLDFMSTLGLVIQITGKSGQTSTQ